MSGATGWVDLEDQSSGSTMLSGSERPPKVFDTVVYKSHQYNPFGALEERPGSIIVSAC